MKMGVSDKPSQPLQSGAAASILAPSPARPLEECRASPAGHPLQAAPRGAVMKTLRAQGRGPGGQFHLQP